MQIAALTVPELLLAHGAIIEELRRRQIVRSANNPVSDLAELLFCRAFDWQRLNGSAAGYDARGRDGVRYQIKGRRFTPHNKSRKLSAIRNLPDGPFDQLAGVLFDKDYAILRAALVPLAIVERSAKRDGRTNSWIFHLRDHVWTLPGVQDVTPSLRAAAAKL